MPNKYHIPKEVSEVSRALSAAGFENYLVGGCVRDLLMGREPKDWDIATIATPEEIQKVFPDSFYENEFGTVGVKTEMGIVEVTPYRLESSYTDSRHPDRVKWADKVEEDLARRDFTINAMALDIGPHPVSSSRPSPSPRRGEGGEVVLVDPYEGQKDLEKKIIRTVGSPDERFNEDALRLLRALRLASELNFVIEAGTQEAIEKDAHLLGKISKERIRDEFEKIVESENPAVALEMAARLGILKFITPELEKGIGVLQGGVHAYSVWEHLLRSLDHAAKKNYPLHVRLAALFHDIAKPHTRRGEGGEYTFYGHEVVGARLTKNILEDLKFPKDLVEKVTKLVRWHMFFSDTEQITHSAVRRLVRNVGPELIWDLINTRVADRIGTGRPKEEPYRLRKYQAMIEEVLRDPISVKQLKVNGHDVVNLTQSKPGLHVGLILEVLLSEVLNDPNLNTKEYLEKRVKELYTLYPEELAKQGKEARKQNEGEEEKEIEKIRSEYGVR